jgi:hypothetical protein
MAEGVHLAPGNGYFDRHGKPFEQSVHRASFESSVVPTFEVNVDISLTVGALYTSAVSERRGRRIHGAGREGSAMEAKCPDCGTQNYDGSRFCRKCGRTLLDFEATEATTRSLEERERAARGFAEPGDPPRYAPPFEGTPPGGLAPPTGFRMSAGTNPIEGRRPATWPLWLALSVALVVIAALTATLFFGRTTPQASAPAPPAPKTGTPAPAPEAELAPEMADVDPDADETDPLPVPERAKKWIYPGAVADEIHELPGGQVSVELTTDDAFADVVKFYRDRMPNAVRSTSRDEANFVGGEAIVNISGGGGGETNIQLLVHPAGGHPFIPPIPSIPPPPPPPPPPTP